jgi:hypothetical protein
MQMRRQQTDLASSSTDLLNDECCRDVWFREPIMIAQIGITTGVTILVLRHLEFSCIIIIFTALTKCRLLDTAPLPSVRYVREPIRDWLRLVTHRFVRADLVLKVRAPSARTSD